MSEEQNLNEENVNKNIPPPQDIEPPESEINKSDIPKSEKKMEVHHHPHIEKKKFMEYFREFLMLFLAVTLGFFAENLREYRTERNKETEYIASFIKNLIKDTADLNAEIASDNNLIEGLQYPLSGFL